MKPPEEEETRNTVTRARTRATTRIPVLLLAHGLLYVYNKVVYNIHADTHIMYVLVRSYVHTLLLLLHEIHYGRPPIVVVRCVHVTVSWCPRDSVVCDVSRDRGVRALCGPPDPPSRPEKLCVVRPRLGSGPERSAYRTDLTYENRAFDDVSFGRRNRTQNRSEKTAGNIWITHSENTDSRESFDNPRKLLTRVSASVFVEN